MNLAISESYGSFPRKRNPGPQAAMAAPDPCFRNAFAGVTGNMWI